MREGIFVTNYKKCPTCGGSGVEVNPRWARVMAACNLSGVDVDVAIEEEFGVGPGVPVEDEPEEYDCTECGGSRTIAELITMKEALDIIMPSAGVK